MPRPISRSGPWSAVLGSAGFFGVVLTLVAWGVDPAVSLPYVAPKRYLLLLASAGALLLWAVRAPKAPGARLRLTALEAILATSILWSVITNPSGLARQAQEWFWLPLGAFLLALVVRQLFNPPTPEAGRAGVPTRVVAAADLMTALWVVGSALAVHGLADAFVAGGFRPEDGVRKTVVASVLGTPNAFGAFMAAGIIAALASAAAAGRRTVRVLLVGAALLQLGALIGNGSRGALLGLIAAGGFVLWLRSLSRAGNRSVVAGRATAGRWHPAPRAVVAGLVAMAMLALGGLLLNRVDPDSGRGRLIAWEASGAMLSDRPLTGVGAGRFRAEWLTYQAELWRHPDYAEFDRQASSRTHPNSELLHRLAEQGMPGGTVYVLLWAFAVGLLVRAVRRTERTSPVDWGLLALLVAILVHSLLDSVLLWLPTLVTVHLAFGLIPAPVLLDVDLGRTRARRLATAVALGWAATVAVKTLREYPGYELWRESWQGDTAERLDRMVRAQRRVPSEPLLDRDLGLALLKAGRPEEATRVLQQGLDVWDHARARMTLADAQLQLGWLQPAEVNARAAASGHPDLLAPRLLLARIHHARGEDAQARAALASSIRRDTYYQTDAVDSVAARATLLWSTWYDDEPPPSR